MIPNQLPAYILAAAAALTALPETVSASDNPGTHQHGHAELLAAIDGSQIDLIFTSPAYNLLEFEHEAHTEDQKIQVKHTTAWLEITPLVNTPDSGCSVEVADVHYGAGNDNDNRHDHNDSEEPGGHSDIEVTQVLTCSGLDHSEPLTTPLTARFPELEELNVEWAWSGGQGSARLVQGESSFTLTAE